MKLVPINDTAYVIEEAETVTKSGIVLATEQRKGCIGTIYAISDNEIGLKAGDRVIFSKFAVEDVELKDEKGPIKNLKSLKIDSISAILHD